MLSRFYFTLILKIKSFTKVCKLEQGCVADCLFNLKKCCKIVNKIAVKIEEKYS